MHGLLLPRCPAVSSLRRSPTWVNRAGRVDRSACLEVRASEVRPLVGLWRPGRATGKDQAPHLEAEGEVEVTGRLLRRLHAHRLPFALMGDLRTRKSNAMKDPTRRKSAREKAKDNHSRAAIASEHLDAEDSNGVKANASDAMFNPNKGASRTKLLGFFSEPSFMSGWSQSVRVVRWRSHEKLAQHFLICPSCGEKYRKLFAALCSNQELEDAATAEAWIERVEARHAAAGRTIDAAVMTFRTRLIERYGLLFRRRRLVCRKCLGMRYGQVRRRNGTLSKRQDELEEDASREQAMRAVERRKRRSRQASEWRRVVRTGFAELEKVRAALARMKEMERLVARFEKNGDALMRRAIEAKLRAEREAIEAAKERGRKTRRSRRNRA